MTNRSMTGQISWNNQQGSSAAPGNYTAATSNVNLANVPQQSSSILAL